MTINDMACDTVTRELVLLGNIMEGNSKQAFFDSAAKLHKRVKKIVVILWMAHTWTHFFSSFRSVSR